jgi:predicted nucleic acid-binding protein
MIMPDGNLLIAFKWLDHDHHLLAQAFFGRNPKVVTCPITELNLVRVLMQKGHTPSDAAKSLADFIARHGSKLIPADISATEIAGFNVGHRTTTDSYLAMLAKRHGLKIATLDQGFANRFPSIVEFVS